MSRSHPTLLVVDDDPGVVELLTESLTAKGYAAEGETDPQAALQRIRAQRFDLVIADVEMPGLRGPELVQAALDARPDQLMLLMSAFASVDLAVSAVRDGACDFISKPFTIDALVLVVERALRERQLRREVVRLRARKAPGSEGTLVAESAPMRAVMEIARRASRSAATVLLTGETGTGKSALARFIHTHGERARRPFVSLNCAAIPSQLIEAELFGVKRGAFTDAREDRPGALVSAGEGTLFLDEVGELPLELQSKLLHVLDGGPIRSLGGGPEVVSRARVIAATNQPLETTLREGRFRPDLYYRLNVIRIEVPPLRERRDDLRPLMDALLARAGERESRPVLGISDAATRRLLAYPWPGNVRELSNVLERAVALTDHDTLLPEDLDLPREGGAGVLLRDATAEQLPLEAVERAYVRQVLEAQGGNKALAARILGINRRTLYRKLGEG